MSEIIHEYHFVYRRLEEREISSDGFPISSSLDDKDSELSVDWCRYNGCKESRCDINSQCMRSRQAWEATINRAPKLAYVKELLRNYPLLNKEILFKFFNKARSEDKIQIKDDKQNILKDKFITAKQKEMLLEILDQQAIKFKIGIFSVKNIRSIPNLNVYHSPSKKNQAHSIIDEKSFLKDSPEREDMLEELRHYAQIVY